MIQTKFGIALIAFSLGGCGSAATAETLPSSHCMAVFSAFRELALRAKPQDLRLALNMTARGIYEAKKVKDAGNIASSKQEGEAFFKDHENDWDLLKKVHDQCSTRQDNDPKFKALNESGELMKLARKDPACQSDTSCRASQ
ncbi:hypothetical protein QUC32_17590 [Novosphingobium resinovorum]|jgi:hypothetical protein|uniref:hypothetical protein n=1 Tax=Sphingomonadaceae TaxID=41297 RepID=UPI0012EA37F6|nr:MULTISPECIES: hypothetical protein [Sphingomonadaceae]MBF7011478.1 hypothetical protein [Novosphingobium sp. HR1a]WJM29454.1 hypothetical protein QUC32_17590 [Novosphingobium resinovorum]